MTLKYGVADVAPYINWIYFFHAWSMNGKPHQAKEQLRREAEALIGKMQADGCHTMARFGLFSANSEGDDVVIGGERVPFLRQQQCANPPYLSLADYIVPAELGREDRIGVFAATVDHRMETDYCSDDYQRMLSQTVADRLAEATAERMHEEVRKQYWGYAPDENLSVKELHQEKFVGIRPAVGYPSMPDTSINFVLDSLIGFSEIGIRLTESGMMTPHASVSGLMFAHPQARYFDLGKIGEDQLRDYARRRGLPLELVRRFLQSSLLR